MPTGAQFGSATRKETSMSIVIDGKRVPLNPGRMASMDKPGEKILQAVRAAVDHATA